MTPALVRGLDASVGDQLELVALIGLAVVLGAVIGAERELANKSAGLRTHALVAAGSALAVAIGHILYESALDDGGRPVTRPRPARRAHRHRLPRSGRHHPPPRHLGGGAHHGGIVVVRGQRRHRHRSGSVRGGGGSHGGRIGGAGADATRRHPGEARRGARRTPG
jgi:hypothetical protein